MGIKSTITLTREECIRRIASEEAELARRRGESPQSTLSDDELEDRLEELREANGHRFDNYLIVDKASIKRDLRRRAENAKRVGWPHEEDHLKLDPDDDEQDGPESDERF